MSGSAALSAARKRRASGGGPIMNSASAAAGTPAAYYNRGQPSAIQGGGANDPQNYIQSYPQNRPRDVAAPSPSMNIYENIELIKQQLEERTKKIQREGSTIPPEQLRMLQKQNEIQTQILKQKMMIAKQMESAEGKPASVPSPMINEPEFIYERGVPRKNPKYMNKNEMVPQQQQQKQPQPQPPAANRGVPPQQDNVFLTPFVSMFSDTGAIPPPIVVLKSYDAKIEEHNNLLHDIVEQIVELQKNRQAVATVGATMMKTDNNGTNESNRVKVDAATNDVDNVDEEDEELLMDVVMSDLTNSREFVEGIVNKIVNETNLSEVIMKIEPLVKENQELRSLIHSQQQMMNEMNTMLLRLLNKDSTSTTSEEMSTANQQCTYQDNGLDGDGLYQSETTEIVLPHYDAEVIIEVNKVVVMERVAEEEEAEEEAEEETVAATEATEEEEEEEATEAEPVLSTVSLGSQDEDYSSPHFPDPISLIVRDIDHSDNA
jgi:hypothetical protein